MAKKPRGRPPKKRSIAPSFGGIASNISTSGTGDVESAAARGAARIIGSIQGAVNKIPRGRPPGMRRIRPYNPVQGPSDLPKGRFPSANRYDPPWNRIETVPFGDYTYQPPAPPKPRVQPNVLPAGELLPVRQPVLPTLKPVTPKPFVPKTLPALPALPPLQPVLPQKPVIEPQRQVREMEMQFQNAAYSLDYQIKKRLGTLRKVGGRYIGPLGQFGDDLIVTITLKTSQLPKGLSLAAIKRMLLNEFYEPLKIKAHKIIDTYVPCETGALRDSLKGMIDQGKLYVNSFMVNQPFQVFLGTPGVEYAKPVNKMPTKWVRHFGLKIGRRSGRPLYDPEARQGYYDLTLRNIRNYAKTLWNNWRLGSLGNYFAPLKKAGLITNVQQEIKKIIDIKIPGLKI